MGAFVGSSCQERIQMPPQLGSISKLVLKQSLHMQLYLSLVQQDACAEADIPAGL